MSEGLTSSRLNDIWSLDSETMIWRPITPAGSIVSPKLMQHVAVTVESQIIIFGGISANAYSTSNVFVFDTGTVLNHQPRSHVQTQMYGNLVNQSILHQHAVIMQHACITTILLCLVVLMIHNRRSMIHGFLLQV